MSDPGRAWWAEGLLFENCTCQLVCPGHMHFSQLCTVDPCESYWAVRVDAGRMDDVSLSGLVAVLAQRTPQRMLDGDWTQLLIVDSAASDAQVSALEDILFGRVGGPWAVLQRFVGKRLPTRRADIRIQEDDSVKAVAIDGLLDARIENIRGLDRSRPATFENLFNQIHAPEQVIARGTTTYDLGELTMGTSGTHAIHSRFSWRVDA